MLYNLGPDTNFDSCFTSIISGTFRAHKCNLSTIISNLFFCFSALFTCETWEYIFSLNLYSLPKIVSSLVSQLSVFRQSQQ